MSSHRGWLQVAMPVLTFRYRTFLSLGGCGGAEARGLRPEATVGVRGSYLSHTLYLRMHQIALKPSFQPIFLPSS